MKGIGKRDGTIVQRRQITLHSVKELNRKTIGEHLGVDMTRLLVGHASKRKDEGDYLHASSSRFIQCIIDAKENPFIQPESLTPPTSEMALDIPSQVSRE
ncbi:MAG: hypothetical protein ACFFD6_10620 [Candidatus Thorarchaeota archaeon]